MRKLLVVFAIFTLLFIGSFGLNLAMSMDEGGKMNNCPLMSNPSSFCQMGVGEHIAKWQQMFQALPFSGAFSLFLLGFVLAVWSLSQRTYFSLAPPLKLRLYKKEHPDREMFNPLLLAISKGTLQPRFYA
jgi:hypothetical protein